MRGFRCRPAGSRRIYGAELLAGAAAGCRIESARPECLLVRWIAFELEGNIMVVIRLARGGAKKRPFYNIVVADSRSAATAASSSAWASTTRWPPVASSRCAWRSTASSYWAGVGAQLSPTVARLVAQAKAAA